VGEAHRSGIRFGLRVPFTEISAEMSRRHPDWLAGPPPSFRPPASASASGPRVCLGNPEARAMIEREIERIVPEYGVDLIEDDGSMDESCRAARHGHQTGDGGYAATRGFYQLCEHLTRRFPHLQVGNCTGGGHLIELGATGDPCSRSHRH